MKNIGSIIMNIISLIIAIAGGLMAMDATIHAIGLFSPEVSFYWPLVLAASTVINRLAVIIKSIVGDLLDDGIINNSYPKALPVIACGLLAAFLCGCATNTPDAAKNARNAGLNAAGSQALREAGRVIGNTAVQILFATVQSEATGGKVDYAQSAANAVWSQATAANLGSSYSKIIDAYSAGKMAQTAKVAEKVANLTLASGEKPANVSSAIASVISTAAGAPPKP